MSDLFRQIGKMKEEYNEMTKKIEVEKLHKAELMKTIEKTIRDTEEAEIRIEAAHR